MGLGLGDLSDVKGGSSPSKSLACAYHPTSWADAPTDEVVFDRATAAWLWGRFQADEARSLSVLKETHPGKVPSYKRITVELSLGSE